MSKVNGVRLSDELNRWVEEYAVVRGVEKTVVLRQAVEEFRVTCERGVPDLVAASLPAGVGLCPEREDGGGHVWVSHLKDPRRPCSFCGLPGRGDDQAGEGGNLRSAGLARSEFFSGLQVPMVSGSGDPKKAWPNGMPAAMAAAAARVVAEKKVQDAQARESGVGRPGQLKRKS